MSWPNIVTFTVDLNGPVHKKGLQAVLEELVVQSGYGEVENVPEQVRKLYESDVRDLLGAYFTAISEETDTK